MKLVLKRKFNICLLCVLFIFGIIPLSSAQNQIYKGADVFKAKFEGKTQPLRDLLPKPGTNPDKQKLLKANKPKFLPPNFIGFRRPEKINKSALPIGEDPIRQKYVNRFMGRQVEPRLVLEGIRENSSNAGVPDTNGEAGPDHYIQIINASFFQIFDKDGVALTAPTSANTIWSEIGRSSFSDPVIQYDEAAGRWLLTDLANINIVLYGVSETADPMGSWFLYSQNTPGFADYPKYGIWPNSYILTINEGQGTFPVYALNRQQMLAGEATIDVQRIDIPAISGAFPTVTPMDWNSPEAPPTDEVFAVRMNDDGWGNGNAEDLMEIWKIIIDWDDESNTSFSSVEIPVSPFDSDGCSVSGGFACIPQPGTNQGIDGIMTIVMNNVSYWNFGTHESAVITFSVDAGDDMAGIRWMEMRRAPAGEWMLYQEGTYAPDDGEHRFIPSISMNGRGDIAIAYSVGSENTFASLRYTGRLVSDPLGEMSVDEYEFATGLSARNGDRFGDYAKMCVDPVNGSFWFTSEYMLDGGEYGTKIVNFSLTKDTLDIAARALNQPQSGPDLSNDEAVVMTIENFGLEPATDITVGYIFENEAGVVEMAAIDTLFPDSMYTHTFMSTVDMSDIREYNFQVFTHFDEDQQPGNDTLRVSRSHLPRFDAGIIGIDGVDAQQCDSTATGAFVLNNFGVDTLRSVSIVYSLNGGTERTLEWTGELATGASATVMEDLNEFMIGANILSVRTVDPNGETDQNMSNDAFNLEFERLANPRLWNLVLTLDAYPEETSWALIDQDQNTIYSGVGGSVPNAVIQQEWCLATGQCYDFVLSDSYGDGLFSGGYTIEDEEGSVVASIITPFFGYQEINSFCVNEPCNLEATVDITDAQNDVVNSGAIMVTVTSGASPFMYSIDNGMTFQNEPLFPDLPADTYQVVVTDANNCTWTQEAIVSIIVATAELTEIVAITVSPNPSSDGMYLIQVTGSELDFTKLDYQILTADGQAMMHGSIPNFNGHYEGRISLYNYASGVYYIRFKNQKINQLTKVVRL